MLSRLSFGSTIISAALLLGLMASGAHALSIDFGGGGDPSLHGATGSLSIAGPLEAGTGSFDVAWSMNFEGYEGSAGNHQYLTEVAFKAFHDMTSVTLDNIVWTSPVTGSALYPANVNNSGCVEGSSAGMVCVTLDPRVDATNDGVLVAHFTVMGEIDLSSWSYRGKFGPENGWVISESGGAAPVPEPSAALVFAAGLAVASARMRRTQRRSRQ